MKKSIIGIALLLSVAGGAFAQEVAAARRRAYLTQLQAALPASPHWNAWLARTGELPPDFSALTASADLPDPLVEHETRERQPIASKEAWQQRRAKLKQLLQHYVTGTFPPAPANLKGEVLKELKEGQVTLREVLLRFGPNEAGRLHLTLLIPASKGPLPVFIGTNRSWAGLAVERGYLACLVAASDRQDDTEEFARLYPDHDFTCLARRAWGVSRAIDYLHTLPEVNKEQIVLSDHSRGGKMATWAAAFDDRLTAVVGSSSVTGGSLPWRYATDRYANETLEQITRNYPHWFHPRLRFFAGRENQLPVDMHELVALIAPRAYMITLGTHESEVNPWGEERSFLAARRVYELLGARDRLALRFRPGLHTPAQGDLEAYFDWFDAMLGRKPGKSPDRLLFDYSFAGWQKQSGITIDAQQYPERGLDDLPADRAAWNRQRVQVRSRILDMLGKPPARPKSTASKGLGSSPPGSRPAPRDYVERIIGRPVATQDVDCAALSFAGVNGLLYYPRGTPASRKLPVVILLHPNAHARGYSLLPLTPDSAGRSAYLRGTFPLDDGGFMGTDFKIGTLAQAGFAVFAFDMVGFGTRLDEAKDFYRRHPDWSLLGKMVDDVSAAVDMLAQNDRLDPDRIHVMGYALGATVALHAAALDERLAGACALSGFTPLRLETAAKGTHHLQELSELHGLAPRLGFFRDEPRRLPFDYHEVLSLIAPRPVLVVAPKLDQTATHADVKLCVGQARKIYELMDPEEPQRVVFDPTWSGQWRDPGKHAARLRRLELYAPDEFDLLAPRTLSGANYWARVMWRP
ncbi:MAG: dienelactone hydrolase family protein [Gemmataceae bacterium]